jgi:hypothetical protein
MANPTFSFHAIHLEPINRTVFAGSREDAKKIASHFANVIKNGKIDIQPMRLRWPSTRAELLLLLQSGASPTPDGLCQVVQDIGEMDFNCNGATTIFVERQNSLDYLKRINMVSKTDTLQDYD